MTFAIGLVIDSYPIELIFPIREGRSDKQVGKKGRDKGRWSIGVKLCWLINEAGKVVAWNWDTVNVSDKMFNPLVRPFEGHTIVLADYGFRDQARYAFIHEALSQGQME